MRIAIVGAGTFGCVIGAALQREGCKIDLFDCRKKNAASLASGFLMKPSWFRKMKGSEQALELLDELYGLQELCFFIGPIKTKVFRVSGKKLLSQNVIENKVADLNELYSTGVDKIIIAAGIWSKEFADINVIGKTGISFIWKGSIPKNIIKPWAPFKQVVAFNVPHAKSVWAGDGSAILEKNWTEDRERYCEDRVFNKIGPYQCDDNRGIKAIVGIRPYVKTDQPCLLQKVNKKLWIATGGAKNGTIAAAWAANRLIKEL